MWLLNEALHVPVTLELSYFQCIFKSFIYFDIYVYIYPVFLDQVSTYP